MYNILLIYLFAGRYATSWICRSQGTRFYILMSSLIRHGCANQGQSFQPTKENPGAVEPCNWGSFSWCL